MNDDLRWLIRLGNERGLFSAEQGRAVVAKLGESADLMAFAQELIDSGMVTAVEKLEEIAGEAIAKAAEGPPAEVRPAPVTTAAKEAAPSSTTGSLAFETLGADRKSTRLNSSHTSVSRMPSSA